MLLKKQKIILSLFVVLLAMFFITAPHFSEAAGLVPCGGYGTDSTKPCTVLDMFVLVAKITNFLIACSGIYAVYVIINNSFWLILSVGNEENITKHKGGITNAIVGFVLVLMSYMLVNTVVNVLLTRSLVTGGNPECKLDLTNPTTYLKINESKCNTPPGNHSTDHGLTPTK